MNITRTEISSPIDINKVKQHLRIFTEEENEYIEDLINYAIDYIENRIYNNVKEYTTTITGDFIYCEIVKLSRFKSITSIKKNNVDFTNYELIDIGNDTYIKFLEDADNTVIVYKESQIDKPIINHAVNLLVGDFYENREGNLGISYNTLTALDRILNMFSLPIA